MTYTPPTGHNVNFELFTYTPPTGHNVNFEMNEATVVNIKIKIAGTFVDKPMRIKIGGTFVSKGYALRVI